jgi:hypothetical protein
MSAAINLPEEYDLAPFMAVRKDPAVGVVTGWRGYSLLRDYEGRDSDAVKLKGSFGMPWESRRMTAACVQRGDAESATEERQIWAADHLARRSSCDCGIYAYKTRGQGLSDRDLISSQSYAAVAQMVLWGYVYEHSNGYKAQHARIERLIVAPGMAEFVEPLEARYEVPVEIAGETARIKELQRELRHAYKLLGVDYGSDRNAGAGDQSGRADPSADLHTITIESTPSIGADFRTLKHASDGPIKVERVEAALDPHSGSTVLNIRYRLKGPQ